MIIEREFYRKAFFNYIRTGVPIDVAIKNRQQTGYYIWRTAGDDKVRASHANNNGRIISWDDPEIDEHPGEGFNCRCTAERFMPDEKFRTSIPEFIGGERPSFLLLPSQISSLSVGEWTTADREEETERWHRANRFNLEQQNGYQWYRGSRLNDTLRIRAAFYHWIQLELEQQGHQVRWPGAAGEAVEAAYWLNSVNPFETEMGDMIQAANDAIIADMWPRLAKISGQEETLAGQGARFWDMTVLAIEQISVQPIYDKYADTDVFAEYEANASWSAFFSVGFINRYIFGVDLPKFEGNIHNPADRWVFGMRAMGYEGVTVDEFPIGNF